MVVLMVAATFLLFVIIDLIRERRTNALLLEEGETVHAALQEMEPEWVSGFQLKPALAYHPGHLWVHRVSKDQGYVGLDDFARRLVGPLAQVAPFEKGTHVSQGGKGGGYTYCRVRGDSCRPAVDSFAYRPGDRGAFNERLFNTPYQTIDPPHPPCGLPSRGPQSP